MARPLRIQFQGAWYHVMNRGAGRRLVFINDKQRLYFLELLGEISQIYGIEIHAYCLMGNHYHLIIHTPRGNLSEAMRHINSRYTQFFNRSTHKDGALFRGRYKAIVVSAEQYLLRLSRYIHINPKTANMISDLKNYRWSSYPAYLGYKNDLPSLKTDEVLSRFEKLNYKGSYKKFVETTNDEALALFYTQTQFHPVLGDKEYADSIFEYLKKQNLSKEIIGIKNIPSHPSLEEIALAVAKYFDIKIHQITQIKNRRKNPARQLTMLLARELSGYSLQEIANFMGGVGYSLVSKTISRVKKDKTLLQESKLIINNNFL